MKRVRGPLLALLLGGISVMGLSAGEHDALAQSGRRPWLGVAMAKSAPGDEGVLVKHVVRGSPAAKGGLKDGDRIVSIDGAKTPGPADVTRAVGSHAIGEGASVEIVRAGAKSALKITLAEAPSSDELLRMDHVGSPARPWTGLKAANGAMPASLGALKGKVVIVDFWATWCGPCRALEPVLAGWQKRFGAQGLTVVAISTEAHGRVAEFAARAGMKHPVAVDTEGETSAAYGVSSLPTMFVVDKRGVVRDVHIGVDEESLSQTEALLRTLLAEQTAPGDPSSP